MDGGSEDRVDWVTVEVDVATARPPAVHARAWVTLAVQPEWFRDVGAYAEELACQIVSLREGVVMAVGARVVDWGWLSERAPAR